MTLSRDLTAAAHAATHLPAPEPALAFTDALPGIGLEALTARAELLTRIDRKYVLTPAALPLVGTALGSGAHVLEIDGQRTFAYASTYFDTPALDSYRATAHRRRRRFKIRTRRYLDTGADYLEVKTRGARGVTVKERLRLAPGEAEAAERSGTFSDEAIAYLNEALAPLGLPSARELALAPVLTTVYDRTTLVTGDWRSRVTIDTTLNWLTPAGSMLAPRGACIVETKSPGGPNEIDHRLWRAGHRPERISKFGTGMAALHPALPSNRWHRLLARLAPGT